MKICSKNLSIRLEERDKDLWIVFNRPQLIQDEKKEMITVNATFVKEFYQEHVIPHLGKVIKLAVINEMTNAMYISGNETFVLSDPYSFKLENVTAVVTDTAQFELISLRLIHGRAPGHSYAAVKTKRYLEQLLKFFGGIWVEGHWSLKYGYAVAKHVYSLKYVENEVYNKKCLEDEYVKHSCISDLSSYIRHVYRDTARDFFIYALMPITYTVQTLGRTLTEIGSVSTEAMCKIDEDVVKMDDLMTESITNDMTDLIYIRGNISFGYNYNIKHTFEDYYNEMNSMKMERVLPLPWKRVVVMMVKLPNVTEFDTLVKTFMWMGMTPLHMQCFENQQPHMYDYSMTNMKLEPIHKKHFCTMMMLKPLILIECIAWGQLLEHGVNVWKSDYSYIWVNYTIDSLLKAAEKEYKQDREEGATPHKRLKVE